MNIIFNGRNYGEWNSEGLPRLAAKLGVTVEALMQSSEIAAETSQKEADFKKQIKTRLGPQAKISAVTANVSTIAVTVALALLKVLSDTELSGEIEAVLNDAFDDVEGEAVTELIAMLERLTSREVKTPVTAMGLVAAIKQADMCANTAHDIIVKAAAPAIRNKPRDPSRA